MARNNYLMSGFVIVYTFTHRHFRTAFTDLNLYWIKGALALFVLVSGYVC